MADQKLSQIDLALPLTGAEDVYVVQDGAQARVTTEDIARCVQPMRGQASRVTTGEITITTQGVYVATGLVATFDSATASGMTLGTVHTFGVKNTSGGTRLVQIYGSIDAVAGNNKVLGVKLALNGVAIDATECRAFTGAGGQEAKLVTNWMISMADDDEVSLFIANHTSTANIEFRRGRIVASEVR
jgi:hypothetical protein